MLASNTLTNNVNIKITKARANSINNKRRIEKRSIQTSQPVNYT